MATTFPPWNLARRNLAPRNLAQRLGVILFQITTFPLRLACKCIYVYVYNVESVSRSKDYMSGLE